MGRPPRASRLALLSHQHAVTAMGEALRLEIADTDIAMTLIEPGAVDTPFFDNRPSGALEADDIARAVMFALTHPPHVDVNELLIRPKPI